MRAGSGVRAISPIIAVALLVLAAIAAGLMFYKFIVTGGRAIAQQPHLIVTARATVVGSTTYVELSAKNDGGAAINITTVQIDGNTFSVNKLLKPGEELHKVFQVSNLPPGDHIVIVKGVDGSGNEFEFTGSFRT